MPFRLGPDRKKIQFLTSASMPMMIFRAREPKGESQTRYIQIAVAQRLARDLQIPIEDILADLPPTHSERGDKFAKGRGEERVREKRA